MFEPGDFYEFRVVAYHREGEEGWRVCETTLTMDVVRAVLDGDGSPVVDVRLVESRPDHFRTAREPPPRFHMGSSRPGLWGWVWDEAARCWRAPEDLIPDPSEAPPPVDAVSVSFEPAEHGWQPVCLSAGGRSLRFDASHLYDPFPVLLDWLEAVAVGRRRAAITDLENQTLHLFAFPVGNPARVGLRLALVVDSISKAPEVQLDIDVERWRFVSAVYGALRRFAESDRYDADHFGSVSFRESLIRKGYSADASALADQDAVTLNRFFWDLYPHTVFSFGPFSEPFRDVPHYPGLSPPTLDADGWLRTPLPRFRVPHGFEGWDADRRQAYMAEMLDDVATCFECADMRTLRSPVIEAYLGWR